MMPHQLHNVLASLSMCLPLGVDIPAALKTLIEFPGLPHRVEYLGRWSEVKYYNDSKATNVHACSAALTALEGPLILLAGGKPKAGEPYEDLLPLVKKKCREIILFGEARDILQQAWQSETLNMNSVETLEEATQLAIERAQPGDSILLSPACASFDRFQNFEQRGNFFKSLISDWVVEKTT
jgi:UDP-N-acetylmuramoylalanine--D-glutamate ligase